jgi:hypothetical protein
MIAPKTPGSHARRNIFAIKGMYTAVGATPEETSHALPTLPADLAEVVERWDSLPTDIKAEVLRLIRQS